MAGKPQANSYDSRLDLRIRSGQLARLKMIADHKGVVMSDYARRLVVRGFEDLYRGGVKL